MKIETNLPKELMRKIGVVGFDRVTLTGFLYSDAPFIQPVADHCAICNGAYISLRNCVNVATTPSTVTIHGKDYTCRLGNKNGKPFFLLELHSRSTNDIADNLNNLCVGEIWEKLIFIAKELNSNYYLNVTLNPNMIRIAKAEINLTVRMKKEYENYNRIYRLLSYGITECIRNTANKHFFMSASVWTQKGKDKNEKTQTTYLYKGSTKSIKVYDKGEETKKAKSNREIKVWCNLLRCEITTNGQNLNGMCDLTADSSQAFQKELRYDKIPPSDDKKILLKNITDESVKKYFTTYIQNGFNAAEEYLEHQLKDKIGSISPLMSHILYKNLSTDSLFIESTLLNYFYVAEKENGLPLILDIDDVMRAFLQRISDINTANLFSVKILEKKEEEKNKIYHTPITQNFLDQKELYSELKNQLTNPIPEEITFVVNDQDNSYNLISFDRNEHMELYIKEHHMTYSPFPGCIYEVYKSSISSDELEYRFYSSEDVDIDIN